MYSLIVSTKRISKSILIVLTVFLASFACVSTASAKVVVEKSVSAGVIKGVVRDSAGNPIADATVAIFRLDTSNLLKQVRSAADGSFLAKIIPGTYKILAIAEGFNPVVLSKVEIGRSSELVYKFKLEPSGGGNTLPEKRADRNSPKWRIRAAQSRRSIYQNAESDNLIVEDVAAVQNETVREETAQSDRQTPLLNGQTAVETYFASSKKGNYSGFNFARLQPLSSDAEIVFAGQTGSGGISPQRFETKLTFRPDDNHQIYINGSAAKLGKVKLKDRENSLGQVSIQALDEWKIKSGIILVFGFDYSRFVGAGDDFSVSPRFGFQYDIDSKTRFRTAYTTQNEDKTWQQAIELEDTQILFREPVAVQDFVIEDGKPKLNKSSRFEFGVERVLDNNSNVEVNVFLDATAGRGVGLTNMPLNPLNGDGFNEIVGNQQGAARGVRVVYTRRLNGMFSTSAGYAFGSGQKISAKAISDPANIFENDSFQSIFGQFVTDIKTGTRVKTVFRLSPQATVFAIDPFQGGLAIYDPSLSVLVTQSLPSLGLPIRAEAVIDARNLLDFPTGAIGEEGSLRLNAQGRALRGGILVRF